MENQVISICCTKWIIIIWIGKMCSVWVWVNTTREPIYRDWNTEWYIAAYIPRWILAESWFSFMNLVVINQSSYMSITYTTIQIIYSHIWNIRGWFTGIRRIFFYSLMFNALWCRYVLWRSYSDIWPETLIGRYVWYMIYWWVRYEKSK